MHATSLATAERRAPAGRPEDTPTAANAASSTEGDLVDRLLRCVSSGYLSDGCSCRSAIPSSVVSSVWASVLDRGGESGDRFFRFVWRGGVWLGFGLQDGRVRGVYCPEHSAARAERCAVPVLGVAS
jgi:hypothetical protein